MPFEDLSYRFIYEIPNYPPEWFSLVHLYDPDTLLFPLYYFHILPENLSPEDEPEAEDEALYVIEVPAQEDAKLITQYEQYMTESKDVILLAHAS